MPIPSRTLARQRPRPPLAVPWNAVAWVGAVLVTSFGAFAVVQPTGGSPNAFNNLGYVLIALAAYRFGLQGGPVVGALVGLLMRQDRWWIVRQEL